MVVTCAPAHGGALPATEISHGKPVVITMPDSRYRGFVFSTSEATIDVCVDVGENGEKIALGDRLDIMPAPDDITYRRMKAASEEMKKMIETRSSRTVDIIFGESQPYPQVSTESFLAPKTDVKNLNKEQLEAVRASLAIQDLMCLHGPPGTGKSTTVAAIVAEAAQRGIKTIVTCPSNAAVDALVEKLAKRREVVVTRLGHPARTSPHLRQYTLEAKMADVEMLRGLKSDMYAASGRERGELRKELRDREKKCSTEILANSHAVVATCTVVGMKSILDVISDPEHFGLAIVDEAGQAVEPAIYPILRRCSKKLILAGDPAQLPPTVMSKGASILTKTLLEDLMGRFPSNTVLLKRQYRMNKMISDWVSDSMYRGELIADESVQNHTLGDLLQDVEGVAKLAGADFVKDILSSPMTLIDTVGSNMDEDQVSEDQSKVLGEAILAALTTKILIKAGIKPKNIAIISPYAAQVQLIAKLVGPAVSVRTVDGYQGGEAEVVILSLVRSNIDGTTGFLSDRRRLNVAVSRARKKLHSHRRQWHSDEG
ncbi:unnamed protein product [Oikopleura dioica]|uniref:AAA+ ATPase domain-containing protein n=1 Tax=Oikopleura dioica TaxID=34765 RepID=E4WYB1_OIKDI|nr:unnamed protein product [Oikopleura dioica]